MFSQWFCSRRIAPWNSISEKKSYRILEKGVGFHWSSQTCRLTTKRRPIDPRIFVDIWFRQVNRSFSSINRSDRVNSISSLSGRRDSVRRATSSSGRVKENVGRFDWSIEQCRFVCCSIEFRVDSNESGSRARILLFKRSLARWWTFLIDLSPRTDEKKTEKKRPTRSRTVFFRLSWLLIKI